MTEYTITRENASLDLQALRSIIARTSGDHEDYPAWYRLREIADSIEEQVKPAIEEPAEFGSVVRAGYDEHTDRVLWVRAGDGWHAEAKHGYHAYFKGLHDPEVLRVGIGDERGEPLAEWETELLNQQERREVAAAVLGAMDVDQYLIDAVANARPR